MTRRFSYFSHIENLKTKILVLTDPFAVAREAGLVCRYSLHRESSELLAPDPGFHGFARWHALLPYQKTELADLDLPIMELTPSTLPEAEACAQLLQVRFNAELPYKALLPALEDHQGPVTACSPRGAARCLGKRVDTRYVAAEHAQAGDVAIEGSVHLARTEAHQQKPAAAEVGTWGHPYRLEAYKCLGLEIMDRHPEGMPVLLVADPSGEMLLGLMLAVQQANKLGRTNSGPVPFRVIALLIRPFHQLGSLFEGGQADWQTLSEPGNHTSIQPPEPLDALIASGLMDLLGTAVILDPEEAPDADTAFQAGLTRLLRTGFIDDEDTVYLASV